MYRIVKNQDFGINVKGTDGYIKPSAPFSIIHFVL